MTEKTPVRVVCFDLGGVMLRICRSWREACEAAGVAVRLDLDEGRMASADWIALNRSYQSGEITGAEFAARFSVMIDGLYAPHEIEVVHDAWVLGEYAGVGEVVGALHAASIVTAVLSNTCHEHWEKMDRYPAVMRVQHRHASHLLAVCKPDEASYLAIETATGHDGASILFFDDLPENIEAAARLGWRAELIDHTGDTAKQMRSALERHGVELRAPAAK